VSFESDRRGIDRRVGLPDTRPPQERADRRQDVLDRRRRADRRADVPPNRALSDPAEQRRLVLYIAADPARSDWLRRFTARHLEAAATALDGQREPRGAEIVRGIAARVRAGDADVW
jgi:hypothetical protein